MYPKSIVYSTQNTELSIEEIRSQKYLRPKPSNRLNVPQAEMQQAIQSILGDQQLNQDDEIIIVGDDVGEMRESVNASVSRQQLQADFRQLPAVPRQEIQGDFRQFSAMQTSVSRQDFEQLPAVSRQEIQGDFRQLSAMQTTVSQQDFEQLPAMQDQYFEMPQPANTFTRPSQRPEPTANDPKPEKTPVKVNLFSPQANKSVENFKYGIWDSPGEESCTTMNLPPKKNFMRFDVFEESPETPRETGNRPPPDGRFTPRGSAMKTPFKVISADDLAETGSRGGLDAVAQPSDGAKRLPIFEDDDDDDDEEEGEGDAFNASCNTQMFNFNLNAMKVSTPQKQTVAVGVKEQQQQQARFGKEEKSLSTILEESKSYG